MVRSVSDGPSTHEPAGGPSAASYGTILPPTIDLDPFTPAELCELIRGGEHEADLCEEILVRAGRAAGAYDLTIGEGLAALRAGDRVAEPAWVDGTASRRTSGWGAPSGRGAPSRTTARVRRSWRRRTTAGRTSRRSRPSPPRTSTSGA
jgi:hypothetical protein